MGKRYGPEQTDYQICLEGAAGGEVTGSCIDLIMPDDSRILLDAGLLQGRGMRNSSGVYRDSLPISKARINGIRTVLLSHDHGDHAFKIPQLVKEGFNHRMYATRATAAFLEPMLYDAAKIQETHEGTDVLYRKEHVAKALSLIHPVDPFTQIRIGGKDHDIRAEFIPSGHKIGAASILVTIPANGHVSKTLLDTGDIGPPWQPLSGGNLRYAKDIPQVPVNTIIMEATKADCDPISFEEKISVLLSTINKVWEGGGNPVFPVLSNPRMSEVLELLIQLQKCGQLPQDCRFIVDAPLGVKILDVIKDLGPDYLCTSFGPDNHYYKTPESSQARFDSPNLSFIKDHQTSCKTATRLAYYPGKFAVLTSGGMCESGRFGNWTNSDFGDNPNNAVILTCFQAQGTQGETWKRVGNIDSENRKRAYVEHVPGFTGHASGRELVDYIQRFNLSELEQIIINHASIPAREALAVRLKNAGIGAQVILPEIGQRISLYPQDT
jgi:metallo-beta-lactamase family protein